MADELIAGNNQPTGEAPAAPAAATAPEAAAAAPQQSADPAAGEKPAEGAKPAAETPAPGAPEKYEFKAPEGAEFDAKFLESYSEAAKELNLPQEAAQKMLDKVAPVVVAQQAAAMKSMVSEWNAASKVDPEFGGDKYEENLGIAAKAYETFTTPELRKLLDTTGLTVNPDVIRVFYRVGKAISEDRFVGGGAASNVAQSVAQRMYPNMNP